MGQLITLIRTYMSELRQNIFSNDVSSPRESTGVWYKIRLAYSYAITFIAYFGMITTQVI